MKLKGGLFGVRSEPPRGEFTERRKPGLHARDLPTRDRNYSISSKELWIQTLSIADV